jgi:predicted CopG family antitoxin
MARLTITLSDERHQQLKLQAAVEGRSIGELIEAKLAERDEAARQRALALASRARATAANTMTGMNDEEIEQWVTEELRSHRTSRATRTAS